MNDLTEARKPPVATTGILGWLRINLFSNWVNSLITLFVLYILIQFIPWILNWTIFAADFKYNFNANSCSKENTSIRFGKPLWFRWRRSCICRSYIRNNNGAFFENPMLQVFRYFTKS